MLLHIVKLSLHAISRIEKCYFIILLSVIFAYFIKRPDRASVTTLALSLSRVYVYITWYWYTQKMGFLSSQKWVVRFIWEIHTNFCLYVCLIGAADTDTNCLGARLLHCANTIKNPKRVEGRPWVALYNYTISVEFIHKATPFCLYRLSTHEIISPYHIINSDANSRRLGLGQPIDRKQARAQSYTKGKASQERWKWKGYINLQISGDSSNSTKT